MRKLRYIINFSLLWFVILIGLTLMGFMLDWLIGGWVPGERVPFDAEFGLILGALAVPITLQIGRGSGLLRG